ncbi:MAG: tRNA (adenosine(37)-N6)-dimethylallyltransferase MiaA [Bacteroidetes bacterium]|nr:tRNA (adenosine(37)-N6)-dimethylallyltransferase MiaA [Bacteroidota bacterium]
MSKIRNYKTLAAHKKTLIVLVGSTASGKTGLAIELAKRFKAEIISADSRQFYQEIPIGTAAPTKEQLQKVPHHFVGNLSIKDNYNVSQFESDVLRLLEEKWKTYDQMIMVGGSGLYVNAVCHGIDKLPDPDETLRDELNDLFEKKGLAALQIKLKKLDPEYYELVDINNPKRLLRAIEVCMQTGNTYSSLRKNKPKPRPFEIVKIGLELERKLLNERIHMRTDEMMKRGWINEAESVHPNKHLNALNTVGYKELFAYFEGELSLEEAVTKIKTNTRRFAKRQMTWFKKDPEIKWFNPENKERIFNYLDGML